jgi:hypothetical protein
MRGLLFDVPRAVEQVRPLQEAASVSGRCDVRAGDFFKTVPGGADAYLLSHIRRDRDDAKAGLILDNLRRAMSTGARLLVVAYVEPDGDGASFGNLLGLHMMHTSFDGRRMYVRNSLLSTLDHAEWFWVRLIHVDPDGMKVDPFFNIDLNKFPTGPARGHDMLVN